METLRKITSAFATEFMSCGRGDIVAVVGKIPQIIEQCSEAYDGPAPSNTIRVDMKAYAHTARKRPAPKPDERITKAEIQKRLGWSSAQWDVAQGLAFPDGVVSLQFNPWRGTEPVGSTKTWSSWAVDRWADSIRDLRLS